MSDFPEIDIRVAAECLQVAPLWDTVMTAFDPVKGDIMVRGEWRMADPTIEPSNAGGMQARQALFTAIINQCFTDCFSKNPRLRGNTDPRGWWGDAFPEAQGVPQMGIELWTLFNGKLDPQVAAQARAFVIAGLQPLLSTKGGPVARFEVTAPFDQVQGILYIQIKGYSEDGLNVYDMKWQYAWSQTQAGPFPSSPSFVMN